MKQGLEIEFLEDGELRLSGGRVAGPQASVQNALINLLVARGSDPFYPSRGTDLAEVALTGIPGDERAASHAANFAAAATLFFSREFDEADAPDHLAEVILVPEFRTLREFTTRATFRMIGGQTLSYPETFTIPL